MKWREDPNRRRGLPASTKGRVHSRDGGRCHICHHTGGAMHLDHVINYKLWIDEHRPGDPDDDSNLALAHSDPCPTCGRTCHDDKTREESRAAQAKVAAKASRPVPRSHPGVID